MVKYLHFILFSWHMCPTFSAQILMIPVKVVHFCASLIIWMLYILFIICGTVKSLFQLDLPMKIKCVDCHGKKKTQSWVEKMLLPWNKSSSCILPYAGVITHAWYYVSRNISISLICKTWLECTLYTLILVVTLVCLWWAAPLASNEDNTGVMQHWEFLLTLGP